MSITNELEAKILRYYHVEKWRIGTISRQLNVHHSVVKRVLLQAGIPKASIVKRTSIIDSFLSFLHEILIKYPKLTASRLYDMACTRGYSGGLIISVISLLYTDHGQLLKHICALPLCQVNKHK